MSIQKNKVVLSPSQCRAARAMLQWSQDDLAKAAGVAKQTLADFEREARQPYERTLADIQAALEGAGIIIAKDGCVCPSNKKNL